MIGQGDRKVNSLHLGFLVLPKRSNGLSKRTVSSLCPNVKKRATHPFKLAAHQQHPSPYSPPRAFLSRDAVEVALAIAQEHLRQTTEAAMLFLVNLCTA